MMWKIVFLAFLATGALAQFQIIDQKIADMKMSIVALCKRNGAEDKVFEVETAVTTFVDFIKRQINVDTIQTEIQEAKTEGTLNEVFKKYCSKVPEFKNNLHTLTSKMSLCVEPSMKDTIFKSIDGTNQQIDYICYNHCSRLAQFFAEDGPECVTGKMQDIQHCIENLVKSDTTYPPDMCASYDKIGTCAVAELKKCSKPAPANIAEDFIRFSRTIHGSPCEKSRN